MEYVLIYAKKKENFNANKPKEDYSIDKFIYEFKELTNGYEFEVKGRKVTYGGYAIYDGAPRTGAFAYGQFTEASV